MAACDVALSLAISAGSLPLTAISHAKHLPMCILPHLLHADRLRAFAFDFVNFAKYAASSSSGIMRCATIAVMPVFACWARFARLATTPSSMPSTLGQSSSVVSVHVS